jgi:hypothetical protein
VGPTSTTRRFEDLGARCRPVPREDRSTAVDADAVVLRADGTPAVGDLGGAAVSAATTALQADRAQLLVATALTVGSDRAVRAAHDALGDDAVAAVLPYLQPAALSRQTRRALSDADWKLDDLRGAAARPPASRCPSSSSSAASRSVRS